ncbi:EF-hand calcium-binding domain-containing protein 9 [Gonapodya sp. JEL0774]|nr:EF-hand calcium-binding domain-containing protein 9 [Gonapodya sp. JEL0774]
MTNLPVPTVGDKLFNMIWTSAGPQMDEAMSLWKKKIYQGVAGDVLEIGAGHGSTCHYLDSNVVTLHCLEPNPLMREPLLAAAKDAGFLESKKNPPPTPSTSQPDSLADQLHAWKQRAEIAEKRLRMLGLGFSFPVNDSSQHHGYLHLDPDLDLDGDLDLELDADLDDELGLGYTSHSLSGGAGIGVSDPRESSRPLASLERMATQKSYASRESRTSRSSRTTSEDSREEESERDGYEEGLAVDEDDLWDVHTETVLARNTKPSSQHPPIISLKLDPDPSPKLSTSLLGSAPVPSAPPPLLDAPPPDNSSPSSPRPLPQIPTNSPPPPGYRTSQPPSSPIPIPIHVSAPASGLEHTPSEFQQNSIPIRPIPHQHPLDRRLKRPRAPNHPLRGPSPKPIRTSQYPTTVPPPGSPSAAALRRGRAHIVPEIRKTSSVPELTVSGDLVLTQHEVAPIDQPAIEELWQRPSTARPNRRESSKSGGGPQPPPSPSYSTSAPSRSLSVHSSTSVTSSARSLSMSPRSLTAPAGVAWDLGTEAHRNGNSQSRAQDHHSHSQSSHSHRSPHPHAPAAPSDPTATHLLLRQAESDRDHFRRLSARLRPLLALRTSALRHATAQLHLMRSLLRTSSSALSVAQADLAEMEERLKRAEDRVEEERGRRHAAEKEATRLRREVDGLRREVVVVVEHLSSKIVALRAASSSATTIPATDGEATSMTGSPPSNSPPSPSAEPSARARVQDAVAAAAAEGVPELARWHAAPSVVASAAGSTSATGSRASNTASGSGSAASRSFLAVPSDGDGDQGLTRTGRTGYGGYGWAGTSGDSGYGEDESRSAAASASTGGEGGTTSSASAIPSKRRATASDAVGRALWAARREASIATSAEPGNSGAAGDGERERTRLRIPEAPKSDVDTSVSISNVSVVASAASSERHSVATYVPDARMTRSASVDMSSDGLMSKSLPSQGMLDAAGGALSVPRQRARSLAPQGGAGAGGEQTGRPPLGRSMTSILPTDVGKIAMEADLVVGVLTARSAHLVLHLFRYLDCRGTGGLDDIQFASFLRSATNLSQSQVERVFDVFDLDRSGSVEFDEFYLLMCILVAVNDNEAKTFMYRHWRTCFELLDEDGSKAVSHAEFSTLGSLLGFGGRAVRRIFDEFDVSGNKELDYNEFKLFVFAAMDAQAEMERRKQSRKGKSKWLSMRSSWALGGWDTTGGGDNVGGEMTPVEVARAAASWAVERVNGGLRWGVEGVKGTVGWLVGGVGGAAGFLKSSAGGGKEQWRIQPEGEV